MAWLKDNSEAIQAVAAVAGVLVAAVGFFVAYWQLSLTSAALRASNTYTIQQDSRDLAGPVHKSVKALANGKLSADEKESALVDLWKMFNLYLAVYRQDDMGGIGTKFAKSFRKDFCDTIKSPTIAAAWDELLARKSLNSDHLEMRDLVWTKITGAS